MASLDRSVLRLHPALVACLLSCNGSQPAPIRSLSNAAPPAGPVLPAPWAAVDFRVSAAEVEKQLRATPLDEPCFDFGRYETEGVCWWVQEGYGDAEITWVFESEAAARQRFTDAWGPPVYKDLGEAGDAIWHLGAGERRVVATLFRNRGGAAQIRLKELIPLTTLLTSGPPDGIGELVGQPRAALARYGRRALGCDDPDSNHCLLYLPPNEGGSTNVGVELERAIVAKVYYRVKCDKTCAESGVLRAYANAAGTPTFKRMEGRGNPTTLITFAKLPAMQLEILDALQQGGVCLGACDRPVAGVMRK